MFTHEEAESVAVQGFRGGALIKLAKHFSQARRVNPQAKQHCFELLEKAAVIGIQTFIDRMAGVVEIPQTAVEPALVPESIPVHILNRHCRILSA